MASVEVKWNGKTVSEKYNQAIADGLTAGAIFLQRAITRNISTPSPPTSKPFNFPHKDTGNLKRSISFKAATTASLYSAAGVSAKDQTENTYALFLEFGTSKMAPRPFLMRSLVENYRQIGNVVNATARRRMNAK